LKLLLGGCRIRAHEALLKQKHETALHNLQQAAGHCAAAGGISPNLDAVADFIRSEIEGNFRYDPDAKQDQASWVSRSAAGLLTLGDLLFQSLHEPASHHTSLCMHGASCDHAKRPSTVL
jgi:hypothetical protein